MEPQITILLDVRREKQGFLYPLKLRVYWKNKAVMYPLIYDLSKLDYEKLEAKRVSDNLVIIRDQVNDIQHEAKVAAKKISPFDFNKFEDSYINTNKFFRCKVKVVKSSLPKQISDEIPEEWKSKFSIFKEEPVFADNASVIYLSIIKTFLYQGRIGTATIYQTGYNSLKNFRGNVRLSEITVRFLQEYEGWLVNEKGNSKTTVSFYTRSIRAVFNEAIENKIISRDDYPFGRKRYAVPSGRNIKKALNKESISKLYYSKIEIENQQKAKDFWFFSFYGNGMNVKDIICLKYKNIKGEFLVFERAKTEMTNRGKEPIIISCFINQDMLDIIEKWGNKEKDPENYIFPILEKGLTPIKQFELKQNFTQFINKNMAKISKKEDIGKNVKTMESRHSASTLMKNAGVSPHFIKEALGHSSLQTTENYLAGFEDDKKKEFASVLNDFKKDFGPPDIL